MLRQSLVWFKLLRPLLKAISIINSKEVYILKEIIVIIIIININDINWKYCRMFYTILWQTDLLRYFILRVSRVATFSTPHPEASVPQQSVFHRSFSQPADSTENEETSIWGNSVSSGNSNSF